ncbi:hypothetical protein [Bartonella ancashensis]
MNYAIVENGVVTNIIVALENYIHPFEGKAIATEEVGIGWTYEKGVFIPPVQMSESVDPTKEDSLS